MNIKHTKDNCTAWNLFLTSCACGLTCGNCSACSCSFIDTIINKDYVIKAYKTPDNKFLKVENKNGAVYTIWEKANGYQMTSPIQPNHKTGSATAVLGEGEWDYGTLENVLEIIEKGRPTFPNFFSKEDIEATKFLTIEQAVELHENIMNYRQIK